MNKDYILLIDDDEKFKTEFESKIKQFGISHDLIFFKNIDEFESKRKEIPFLRIKFVIFDLCTSKGETESKVFKIDPIIDEFYNNNRIIIFIHSAYLHHYEKYPNNGTVFKIEKGLKSIESICTDLKIFEESSFYNIFSLKGSLEEKFMSQIHSAFRQQFSGNEIISIINSIKKSSPDRTKERTQEVFERIAIKCLFHNLYNETSINAEKNTIEDVNINAVENYYIRSSAYKFWTCDIFKKKSASDFVIVLNPRCNISNNNVHHILFCSINQLSPDQLKAFLKEENIRKGLTDDVKSTIIGDRFRFLPKTTKFDGGLIDFNTICSLPPDVFLKDYQLLISISDDLANDIIRKCSSYLVRGGVYINETKEALYFLEPQKEDGK
ncbi:MAG: hypothetical protein KA807_09585 [Prolixibacteraceae bacterium]|nr:hypothetical protein [Prolixibacteraceae bacterium]